MIGTTVVLTTGLSHVELALVAGVVLAAILGVLVLLTCHVADAQLVSANLKASFRETPDHPDAVECTRCGQLHTQQLHNGSLEWRPLGAVKDPACACNPKEKCLCTS